MWTARERAWAAGVPRGCKRDREGRCTPAVESRVSFWTLRRHLRDLQAGHPPGERELMEEARAWEANGGAGGGVTRGEAVTLTEATQGRSGEQRWGSGHQLGVGQQRGHHPTGDRTEADRQAAGAPGECHVPEAKREGRLPRARIRRGQEKARWTGHGRHHGSDKSIIRGAGDTERCWVQVGAWEVSREGPGVAFRRRY